jgi:3' exoribonuclease family, domain 1
MLTNVFVPKTSTVCSTEEEEIKRRNASDGLYPARMRDMRMCCVQGADGSAYLSLGDTVVYCSVYGPRFKLISNAKFVSWTLKSLQVIASTFHRHCLSPNYHKS